MRITNHQSYAVLGVCAVALLLGACSDLKKDLPAPMAPQGVHPAGWNDPTSTSFHGTLFKQDPKRDASCITCHAKALTGGTSGVSCFGCHKSYPHKAGWTDSSATGFHGKFLRLGLDSLANCGKCHGADYSGGTSGKSCYTCHSSYPHRNAWNDAGTAGFHGAYLKTKNWALAECASCHGADFAGGTSGISCFTCHAAFPHSVFQVTSGHSGYLLSKGYPLAQCKTCHGPSYTGGPVVNISCSSAGCHADAGGAPKSPEACNTCHGQFRAAANDALSAAPPKSVFGDSLVTIPGIGAHQKHLVSGVLGKSVKCAECHTVPQQVFTPGHVDTQLPAEVVFRDTLARLITAGGAYVPNPDYNATTLRCGNVYCHGAWRLSRDKAPADLQFAFVDSVISGANYSPSWTGSPADAACASCHSLPPAGHIPASLTSCGSSICHVGVVNGSGNIIDKSKHINGKINVRNTELDF